MPTVDHYTRNFRIPTTAHAPKELTKLVDEMADFHQKVREAHRTAGEARKSEAQREAKRLDDAARAEAARTGKKDPGPKHEEARRELIVKSESDEAKYQAAAEATWLEIRELLPKVAEPEVALARETLEEKTKAYQNVLEDLRQARIEAKDAANDYRWWQSVLSGDTPMNPGRRGVEAGGIVLGSKSHPFPDHERAAQFYTKEIHLLHRVAVYPDDDGRNRTTGPGFG